MLIDLFLIFLKIGAFTFGGGYAMLPIIQREIVERKSWIREEDFLDALVVSQSSPGPVAVNLSIYTGYKVAGIKGALVSVLGTVIPSFVIILVIVGFLYQYRNLAIIDNIFKGVTPAIVGLIISAVYKLIKSSGFKVRGLFLALIFFLLIVIGKITPIYLILVAGLGHIVMNLMVEKK